MRIGLGAMGGDLAPAEEVLGALEACAILDPGDKIVVHGPKHMLFGPGAGMPAGLVASSNTTRRDNRTEQVGAQFSIAEPLNRGKITESDAWTHVWQRTTVYCKNT